MHRFPPCFLFLHGEQKQLQHFSTVRGFYPRMALVFELENVQVELYNKSENAV